MQQLQLEQVQALKYPPSHRCLQHPSILVVGANYWATSVSAHCCNALLVVDNLNGLTSASTILGTILSACVWITGRYDRHRHCGD